MLFEEKTIRQISLILFLIIFLLLIFIDKEHNLQTRSIDSINSKDLNRYVKLEGSIISENIIKNNSFLILRDSSGIIKGISFKKSKKFNKKLNYSFEGKITIYKDEFEIIINKAETIP